MRCSPIIFSLSFNPSSRTYKPIQQASRRSEHSRFTLQDRGLTSHQILFFPLSQCRLHAATSSSLHPHATRWRYILSAWASDALSKGTRRAFSRDFPISTVFLTWFSPGELGGSVPRYEVNRSR